MKKFIVGGFVRDLVMNRVPKDRDWVVVGSSEEEMLSLGFKKVGADFPVFLDDKGEEYALARTERKTGPGYHGFEVNTQSVSLEQDLARRDLTINAMALDEEGNVYDFFGGLEDIDNNLLRHVNDEAFKEDPVRVLRIARFMARWPSYSVAKETKALCREMVANGELAHLTPERVTAEMMKALSEQLPSRFFYFLRMVGALEVVFPEIHALIGVEQPYDHHPEGDAFIHTMMVLDDSSAYVDAKALDNFCALVHDLGKAATPKDKWPHHYGHEEAGYWIVQTMAERLKLPTEFREHGALVARYHMHIHKFHELNPKTIVKMFEDLKGKVNKRIYEILPSVSYCDAHGRTSFHSEKPYRNAAWAENTFELLSEVKLSSYFSPEEIKEMSVDKIKDFLYRKKIEVVKEVRKHRADSESRYASRRQASDWPEWFRDQLKDFDPSKK
jgi:tRNA nucleotidyltransferase (CCA-adding enzyme)